MGKKRTQVTNTGLDPASQKYVDQMRQMSQTGANTVLGGPYMGGVGRPDPNGYFSGGAPGGAPNGGSWFTGPQTQSIGDQAAAFFNPYQQNVVNAVRGEYDQLRANALNTTRQQATLGGGFGGSRMAVLAGSRLGELDQGQANTISGLLAGGYQNALSQGTAYAEHQRQLQQQQMMEPVWRQQQAQSFMQGGLGPTGSTTTSSQKGNAWDTAGNILSTGAGLFNIYQGMQQPQGGGYQSAPQYGMPQPWQAPSWNPQYRGGFGY